MLYLLHTTPRDKCGPHDSLCFSNSDIFYLMLRSLHLLILWLSSLLLCCYGNPRRGIGAQQRKLGLVVGGDTGLYHCSPPTGFVPKEEENVFRSCDSEVAAFHCVWAALDHLTMICNTAHRTCLNDDRGREREMTVRRIWTDKNMIMGIVFSWIELGLVNFSKEHCLVFCMRRLKSTMCYSASQNVKQE